jgi:hypothetical protein
MFRLFVFHLPLDALFVDSESEYKIYSGSDTVRIAWHPWLLGAPANPPTRAALSNARRNNKGPPIWLAVAK